MNPLTLGLLAAALTVVIVKVARRGRGQQLGLPMDAEFAASAYAPPAVERAPAASTVPRSQSSAGSDVGRVVQSALRAYGNANNRNRASQHAVSFPSEAALNDGMIGPRTTAVWNAVRDQFNGVYEVMSPPLFQTVKLHHLSGYSPEGLIAAARRLEATANNTDYWRGLEAIATARANAGK
jgi:hypothetical protein